MRAVNELTTKHISLYDICGEDHYVFARAEKDGDVTIIVENEDQHQVYRETGHIYAWDSLVSFARMVLSQDAKIQKVLEKDE
jgi:hypothetical protein